MSVSCYFKFPVALVIISLVYASQYGANCGKGYRIFPPSKWIAFGVCGWSIVTILQMTAYNFSSLIVCRVFIGIFEGLFGTGVVYYLSLWYHRNEMGVRVFWFLGPTAVAGYVCSASLLFYSLLFVQKLKYTQCFRWSPSVRYWPYQEFYSCLEVHISHRGASGLSAWIILSILDA